MKNIKVHLGLIGRSGSGKELLARMLTERLEKRFRETSLGSEPPIKRFTFSDVLTEKLKEKGWEISTPNKQRVVVEEKARLGEDWLAQEARTRILACTNPVVIIDGIRWPADMRMMRSLPGNFIVAIEASPERRFLRLKARGRDETERNLTWEEFLIQEERETESYIDQLAREADILIDNNHDHAGLLTHIAKNIVRRLYLYGLIN